jgi:uncharacterized protein
MASSTNQKTQPRAPRLRAGNRVAGTDFYGREREIEALWELLLEEEQNVLIVSPRRVGKSSLLQHAFEQPRDGWFPVFVDFQGRKDAVAGLLAIVEALEGNREVGHGILRKVGEAIGQVREVGISVVSLKLRETAAQSWDTATSAVERALRGTLGEKSKLLLLTDELPQLIARILDGDNEKEAGDGKLFLEFLRKIRQDHGMRKGFRIVIAGSVGLKSILRRHNRTMDANDLANLRIGPWSKETALKFMAAISETGQLQTDEATRAAVLEQLGETPIPFHVQKLLAAVRETVNDPTSGANRPTPELVRRLADERIGDFELVHYSERLNEGVPEAEAAFATAVLDNLAANGPQPRSVLEGLATDRTVVAEVMTMLLQEGYLVLLGENLAFATPLLARYWRAHELTQRPKSDAN